MQGRRPSYLSLGEDELRRRLKKAQRMMSPCTLCPHGCRVRRLDGERGLCRADARVKVASFHPHPGEEAPLVGRCGSGAIFFSRCNLRCTFCQNYDIAHEGLGREMSDETLADIMLALQERGVHNINLITPTHVVPNILSALLHARRNGLSIPLCYNTGGYESERTLALLEDVVDIYLCDVKFMDPAESRRYTLTEASDYGEVVRRALRVMHDQVGDLRLDREGIAEKGLILRHLVMPDDVAGSEAFVRFVKDTAPNTYINLMAQYHPAGDVDERIDRSITCAEFIRVYELAQQSGLTWLDPGSEAAYERCKHGFFII